MFEPQPGFGQLFKNTRKTKPNHPDYNGKLNYEGTVIELAGWIKQGKNGAFLSLSAKTPSRGGLARIGGQDEDEIPF